MPDHNRYALKEPPTVWDHLRVNVVPFIVLTFSTIVGLSLFVDGLVPSIVLPSIGHIPPVIKALLGAILVIGGIITYAGMLWRPPVVYFKRAGEIKQTIRVDMSFSIERVGWSMVSVTSVFTLFAIVNTGPWVIASMFFSLVSCVGVARIIGLWQSEKYVMRQESSIVTKGVTSA